MAFIKPMMSKEISTNGDILTCLYLPVDPVALLHDRNVVQVHFYICSCDCFVLLLCCLATWSHFFLLFIASITPSRWWCVWASQQQSVSWWPPSASKQRLEKHYFFFSPFTVWFKVFRGLLACLFVTNKHLISSPRWMWHPTKVCSLSSAWSCSSLDLCWPSSFPFNM